MTESSDPEFSDYERHFALLEKGAEKIIKDTKAFSEAVAGALPCINQECAEIAFHIALFTSGAGFATHFAVIFQPLASELDVIGKHPDAAQTIRSVNKYETAMEEMRSLIGPELELIETRITGPAKELQSIMKLIRKSITKREHKVRGTSCIIISRSESPTLVDRFRSV